MSFQVVITEHPGNVHGRYHLTVNFEVPEIWTGAGRMIPTPISNQGWLGATDDFAAAIAVAGQVQQQGASREYLLVGAQPIPGLPGVPTHLVAPGKVLRSLCGVPAHPSDMTSHIWAATCPACLIVRAG